MANLSLWQWKDEFFASSLVSFKKKTLPTPSDRRIIAWRRFSVAVFQTASHINHGSAGATEGVDFYDFLLQKLPA